MATLMTLWKYRWWILTGILLIVIISLSVSVYFKNSEIDSLNEKIGELNKELEVSYAKLKESGLNLDSCNRLLNESKEESEKRIIDAISKKIEAESIGNTYSPELDRCLRQRAECYADLKKLKEDNQCPACNEETDKEMWDESKKVLEIIERTVNK